MTPSQTPDAAVTAAEAALAGFFGRTPQIRIAQRWGLSCHTRVSELISAVVRGDKDSYLDAVTGRRLMLLALTDEALGQELRAALGQQPHTHGLHRDLDALIADAGRTITLIADHRANEDLTRDQRVALAAQLTALQSEIEAVRADLVATDRIARVRA